MSELMTGQLLKIILGIAVLIVVIVVISVFFGDRVINFFKGLSIGTPSEVYLMLAK